MPKSAKTIPNPRRRRLMQASAALALPLLPELQASAAVTGNTALPSWAVVSDPNTYAQAWAARFTNVLDNPLNSVAPAGTTVNSFYKPDAGSLSRFTISAAAGTANVLGIPSKPTKIWGYMNYETAGPSYPGRSFQVQSGAPITVSWRNNLATAAGPLPHLLPVDQSITMQSPTTGVPLAVHHHGSDSAAEFDGGPDQWQTPVRRQVGPGINALNQDATGPGVQYQYLNTQEASLHWYHDHAETLTRINVHAGLAGLYVVRDANEAALQAANVIPVAPYELALVLQDGSFDALGNHVYAADPAQYPLPGLALPANTPTHFPEMFGDIILVNGKAWPNIVVEPRPYRIRLLNAADSRVFTLTFGGHAQVCKIGSDLGFLNNGVPMRSVTIAPGERMDLVVDFSVTGGFFGWLFFGNKSIVTNSAATPFPLGVAPTGGATQVMRFQVTKPLNGAVPVPAVGLLPATSLRRSAATPPLPPIATVVAALPATTVRRRVMLGEGTDQYGRILPMLGTYDPVNAAKNRGTLTFADAPTEQPLMGSTEIWEFWNTTVDSHPIHMHLVQFRLINQQAFTAPALTATVMANGWSGVKLSGAVPFSAGAVPPAVADSGWRDTVLCPPGQVTRVLVNFKRRGKYVYHCHILSHEDHDMMRWYQVV